MPEIYYKHFRTYIPIFKRQYFKAKVTNNIKQIIEIKDNIWRNWNLTEEQKKSIIKEIGIVE